MRFLRRHSHDLLHSNGNQPLVNDKKADSQSHTADVTADSNAIADDDEDQEQDLGPCNRLSFNVGVSENKNYKYRPTMEDVHTYVANFAERLDWGYFAIFDGHAGKQAARWCGSNLHNILYDKIMKNDNVDLRVNLNSTFLDADYQMETSVKGSSGCTAAVAVLRWEEDIDERDGSGGGEYEDDDPYKIDSMKTPFDFIPSKKHKRMIYTANVGDSRLVLCRNGKAIRLSYDHKSSDKLEQQRIVDSGGIILKNRVNGVLAVSRSLGDVYMKSLVIGSPYTTSTELNEDDEFLIIACDGLWDVCSDQTAVELIRHIKDPNEASAILVNYAMKHMTTDNITVMVVKFDTKVFSYKTSL
ncbi:hypothetical protein CANARDRAFT_196878 [[Candida] arabinofermentans NRRL YB-2248]|uniref:PPM-type phosphatase domain-containing protein n=1 Tax=[Candida] arabinofermentans NRRL YB-2248 TaxID=983967 RepID=A0A1E4T2Y0_9ASCO|nr:hypothetical protein CANARDRAFT_196878 [[Candida] arabinofermentans NRRL YB-2248]